MRYQSRSMYNVTAPLNAHFTLQQYRPSWVLVDDNSTDPQFPNETQDPNTTAVEPHDCHHSHDHGHSHGNGCNGLQGVYSTSLHLYAVLIILVVSFLGAVLPVLGKRVPCMRSYNFMYTIGKSIATGVLLCVALVHMINEASHGFEESCIPEAFSGTYDAWPYIFAMFGALLMHIVDIEVASIVESWVNRNETAKARSRAQEKQMDAEGINSAGKLSAPHDHDDCSHSTALANDKSETAVAVNSSDRDGCAGHQHDFVVPNDMSITKRIIAAICMEFGVTLHSVFIGLAVGVSSDEETKSLLVALVFHQFFEGVAMGSRLADAEFKLSLESVLTLIFSFSAPIGIAIGTAAITASHTALSGGVYILVSNIISSFCGGILLYLAFALMLIDFAGDLRRHCSGHGAFSVMKRFTLYLSLWAGVAAMALIGKWL